MNKHVDLQLLATLGGGIIVNYLFWMEGMGINLLLYSLFVAVVLLLDNQIVKTKKILLVGGSHLLAAILVVINQSELTVITWYISMAVFVGFVHFQSLRSIPSAIFGAFLQVATVPVNFLRKISISEYFGYSLRPLLKPVKYIIIPGMALLLFSILYSIANPVFADYMHQITSGIVNLLTNIFNFFFTELSFLRFLHVILGVFLTGAIFLGFRNKAIEKYEATFGYGLQRKKGTNNNSLAHEIIGVFAGNLLGRKMALKTENVIGIISFSALNLLLLLLNVIDTKALLFAEASVNNLSAELHDGTNALIISVVMAMFVILYFFSGNINFYSKNKIIRLLAYIWIIQNAFLISSVLFRDFQYIDTYGLTYKRIGVLIFLLLCAIGLATVYIKVAARKTVFYLCRVNGFVWYVLLLAVGVVNWDVFIAKYNIENRKSIKLDINHLTSLSEKTIPLLHKNKELLAPYISSSTYGERAIYRRPSDSTEVEPLTAGERIKAFEDDLQKRVKRFKHQYNKTSWLSWNYRDWQTHRYFTKQHL